MIINGNSVKLHRMRVLVCVCVALVLLGKPFSLHAFENTDDKKYLINQSSPFIIDNSYWDTPLVGGDTIFVLSERTKAIKFVELLGVESNPIVVINIGGQVKIDDQEKWGALTFENCEHIKVSGAGNESYKYGFLLSATTCGLAFSDLSSYCEAEFIKISHDGFYGIMAKKNYGGNPPTPTPIFSNLSIHDCFIENVSAGMYLGETTSPGMEFKHVRVYNNIVRNTLRESIQIANMVEDVEVHHNTLLDGGRGGQAFQGNILQIGDNTEAKVYNNVIIGGTDYGIITFGVGNNYFENNYVSSSKGVFIDDRKFTYHDSMIVFADNYFTEISNEENEIIRNMNGENLLLIENNLYDNADALFYRNYFKKNDNYSLNNNLAQAIASIKFTNSESNDYSISLGNPAAYMELGAPGGPEFFGIIEDEIVENIIAKQIVLDKEMITDLVEGGSYWTADYLVDEQNKTPYNDEHAISQQWKPYWNMSKGPYDVYIDLGREYTLTNIAFHDMHNTQNLDIAVGEPGNWEFLFTESCHSFNRWAQNNINVTTRYIRLSMNESVFAAVNEIIVYGYSTKEDTLQIASEEDTAPQIILKSETIVDEVQDGSYWSPAYLVDEQDSSMENNSHPISESWKPHWNMDKGPYHVYIDLEGFYELTTVAVHDMNNTKNLDVSVGEPGNWQHLFTENCDGYKSWKVHEVSVTTRYIRFSMNESVYAAINEILLFGYSVEETYQAKSASIVSGNTNSENVEEANLKITNIEDLFICQNPVQDNLKIHLPVELNENFIIEVYNIAGKKMVEQGFEKNNSSQLMIDISNDCDEDGIYIMRYTNNQGTRKTLKFLKQSYY